MQNIRVQAQGLFESSFWPEKDVGQMEDEFEPTCGLFIDLTGDCRIHNNL